MNGGLDFYRLTGSGEPWELAIEFSSKLIDSVDANGKPIKATLWHADSEIEWQWDWAGFHFVVSRIPNRRDEDYMIPYWCVVIPLTLISAFLLLSKPR